MSISNGDSLRCQVNLNELNKNWTFSIQFYNLLHPKLFMAQTFFIQARPHPGFTSILDLSEKYFYMHPKDHVSATDIGYSKDLSHQNP